LPIAAWAGRCCSPSSTNLPKQCAHAALQLADINPSLFRGESPMGAEYCRDAFQGARRSHMSVTTDGRLGAKQGIQNRLLRRFDDTLEERVDCRARPFWPALGEQLDRCRPPCT